VAFTCSNAWSALDIYPSLDVLIPTGPQMLENHFHINNLNLEFNVSVTLLDGMSEQVQVLYMDHPISSQFDLLASLDLISISCDIRERHMPVVILMPRIFLELCFLFLESLEFNSWF
jgi:hypothetical protein